MEAKFIEKRDFYLDLYKDLNKKYNKISNLRFLIMAVILISGYYIYTSFNYILLGSNLAALGLFIVLIRYHQKVREGRERAKILININNDYLKRIDGNWIDFEDKGIDFKDEDHRYSGDLDIFGGNSLYQMISIANTYRGRALLAKKLREPDLNLKKIRERQKGILELSQNINFVQELEYLTRKNKEALVKPDRLIEYASSQDKIFKGKIIANLVRLIPLLTLGLFFAAYYFKKDLLLYLGFGSFVLQIIILALVFLKGKEVLGGIYYLNKNLRSYLDILKLVDSQDFKSLELNRIKDHMFQLNKSSLVGIKKLDKIMVKINFAASGMVNFLMNILFLWDYQCIYLLESWKETYGNSVKNWIESIGELEVMGSFSVPSNVLNNKSFPKIVEGNPKVEGLQVGHPLISNRERVNNDFKLENEIFIVTGSNMSGKTTFLRTIGINLVLAYNGAVVCGGKMEVSPLYIYTSMRIKDDLSKGISKFYGEILRIKKIIDKSEEEGDMIFLIDEIFTGTNSMDRILGAKNVIRNLNKRNTIGAISTHDLELSNLDRDFGISNFHFQDLYDGDKINFDYKLKEGKSTSTNAKTLMELAGISILEE